MKDSASLNFAAIDIGSNAVRLLIKQASSEEDPQLTKIFLVRVPLRLGQEVFTNGYIPENKAVKLKELMLSFRYLMSVYEVAGYRACATSAMRDAVNGKDIAAKISKETGMPIKIINGKEEAAIVYESHLYQNFDNDMYYVYVDVGGGSTEINCIENGMLKTSNSYNIGTVRLLNDKVNPSEFERMCKDLTQIAQNASNPVIIGSGGNINKLFRIAEIEKGEPLPVHKLSELYHKLKKMTKQERILKMQLKPDRADVIVPASYLFLTIADRIKASEIYVPTIGIGDGIIHRLFCDYLKQKSGQSPC